jgi:hypothetical protein
LQEPQQPATRPLRGKYDLDEIIGYSYRVYLRDFAAYFSLALLTAPLQILMGVLSQTFESDAASATIGLMQIPQAFVSLVVAAALVHEIHRSTGGERPSVTAGLDAAFERFGKILTTGLLLVGLAFASVFAAPFLAVYWLFNRNATIDGRRNWWLAIVPLALVLYLSIRWAFNTQAVMMHGFRNWEALDDSAAAVRGTWWRTFGIMLVVALVILGPTMLAQLATFLPPLAASSIIAGVSALVVPFAIIAQTLLYYDLTTRQALAHAAPAELEATDESGDLEHTE